MEPITPQVKSSEAGESVNFSVQAEGGGTAVGPPNIAWTASNQSVNQGTSAAGTAGNHGRSQSIGENRGPTASAPLDDNQQQEGNRSDVHPPLLRQNSSSLPSFKYLISSVDDPNDKNPIPPIAFSTESNPHTSNSSPIRKQHICYSCKKSFPSKNSLSKHKQIHGERSHICGDCGAKFHTKKDLTRHRDTVHNENSTSYVCPVAECARSNPRRAFSRRDNLRQHILQLHDKRFLDEIKNPQGGSSGQAEKNVSRSPEGASSPLSDETPIQSIDEAIEDFHPLERIEVRTPIQIVMGEDDILEDSNFMPLEEKGKGKSTDYIMHSQQLGVSLERSTPPPDESRDVIMSTPRLLVEDYGTVPEQPLPPPELKIKTPVSSVLNDFAGKAREPESQNYLQSNGKWVTEVLTKIDPMKFDSVAKLSSEELRAQYPEITSLEQSDCLKFALTVYLAGFNRGYSLMQEKMAEALMRPGLATANSRNSLSAASPSHPSDLKAGFSPLTPTSITSPTKPSAAFFGSKIPINEQAPREAKLQSFVVPGPPRSNTITAHESKLIKAEETRPPPRSVATDTESNPETYRCYHQKCNKIFTKKSEWKKHMQRHRRPFFCTFHWQERSEVQRFGSKDDWRRHEEHRHYQSEFYKCPGGPNEGCRDAWSCRQDFEDHLNEHHKAIVSSWALPDGKINESAKKDFLQKHHNGTDYVEDNFWCGFCAKLIPIPPEMTGRRGKEIRVNHVADHFHKEQKDIRLWVKYTECNLAETSKALENAKSNYDREMNVDVDVDASEQQRQLPPIKDIFGSSEPFNAASLGGSPMSPDFWICCECQHLAQNRPNFVYVMNLGKEKECSSNEHPIHTRCPRCSIARSQFS